MLREAAQSARAHAEKAKQAEKDAARAKRKSKEDETRARQREERQKEKAQEEQDKHGRHHWEKKGGEKQHKKERKRFHRDGSARSQPTDDTSKATVSEGIQRHTEQWGAWAASLPRPDAAESAPFPHPKLFSRYLSSKSNSGSDVATATYRQQMRQWHPDKVHQAIGVHLTAAQQDFIYPKVELHCKLVNDAFGK